MKREEKNEKRSRELLEAAMTEFGARDYAEVTLNGICSRHNLSKGLFYHHCSGKDELFLRCVAATFTGLAQALKPVLTAEVLIPDESIALYFHTRSAYFDQHPGSRRIFQNATIRCPAHLKTKAEALRQPLRELNRVFIRQLFSRLTLREGFSQSEAECYFSRFDELYSFLAARSQETVGMDPDQLARKLLDVMLYGVACQPESSD